MLCNYFTFKRVESKTLLFLFVNLGVKSEIVKSRNTVKISRKKKIGQRKG